MRALAVASLLSLASCSFAVKHPAATAAIVGGTLGAATCEIGTDFGDHAACAGVTLGAAALLGGVVLLATAFGGEGDTVLRQPPPDVEQRPEPPSIDDLPPSIDDRPPSAPDASPPARGEPAPAPAPAPGASPATAPDTSHDSSHESSSDTAPATSSSTSSGP